ncbi:MAG TPA: DedA family protein [Kofleriaceae bacterium]|jgi:membrane protein DedA with SNARE-associated domain
MGGLGAYITVVATLTAGALGVPVPEELVLLSAGAAAHRGAAEIWTMLIVAVLAVGATDLFLFGMGRALGPRVMTRAPAKWLLPPERAARVERLVEKHGGKLALAARFLPGMRAPTFLMLGAHKQSLLTFLVGDGIAIAVSVPALVGIGYLASNSIERVSHDLKRAEHWLLLAGVLLIVSYVIYRFVRARRRAQPLPAVPPDPQA